MADRYEDSIQTAQLRNSTEFEGLSELIRDPGKCRIR